MSPTSIVGGCRGQEDAILSSPKSGCEDSAVFGELSGTRGRGGKPSPRPGTAAGTSRAHKRVSIGAGRAGAGASFPAIGPILIACGDAGATAARHDCVAAGHR